MWFLIKGSVWFAAVLVVLSYFSSRPVTESQGAGAIEMSDALSAATGAYTYLAAICSEKPDVCEKGAETLSVIGVRATEGARVAFELLDNQFGAKPAQVALQQDPDPAPFPAAEPQADPIATGTVPLPLKRPAH